MEDKEDKLIEQFLSAGRADVPDNGFTRRVMRRLPDRSRRLSQVWSFCGFTLAVVLFVLLDGVRLVAQALVEISGNLLAGAGGMEDVDLRTALVVAFVLVCVGCRKVVSLA